jgi:hypothetical protein
VAFWNFNLLLLLGGALIAVLYHAGFMKENLIGAMFTGVKHMPADAAGSGRRASPVRGSRSYLLAVAALAVYLIVKRPFEEKRMRTRLLAPRWRLPRWAAPRWRLCAGEA